MRALSGTSSAITRYLSLVENPLGALISVLPITAGQAVQPHGAARRGGMHEASFANVDAGMADIATAAGRKEHQVAGLQCTAFDAGRPQGAQLGRGAWQLDTGGIAIYEADQSATVETARWRIAAPTVRGADQTDGAKQYVAGNRSRGTRRKHDAGLRRGG